MRPLLAIFYVALGLYLAGSLIKGVARIEARTLEHAAAIEADKCITFIADMEAK